MKRFSEDRYVHVLCALFSQDYRVMDYEQMEIQMIEQEVYTTRLERPCSYCNNSKETFNCHDRGCSKAVHVYCAHIHKINDLYNGEESLSGWRVILISFKTLDSRMYERFNRIYAEITDTLENEKMLL